MSRVSVILPVYNSESTVLRALQSVLAQTALSQIKELIIVNDGSKDRSASIIEEFVKATPQLKVRYFYQDNRGVSSARNLGMKKAEGEFIAFLDSDDLWLPTKIERQLCILDKYPGIVFLGSASFVGRDKKGKPLMIKGKVIDTLFKATLKDIYWRHFPVTPSVIFRRFALDKVGYFDENQKYGEDIGYFQRFAIYYNYYYLPEYLLWVSYNKSHFGVNGLSSNFKEMHKGDLKNLKDLRKLGLFSCSDYIFFRIYTELKYWRRIIIRKFL